MYILIEYVRIYISFQVIAFDYGENCESGEAVFFVRSDVAFCDASMMCVAIYACENFVIPYLFYWQYNFNAPKLPTSHGYVKCVECGGNVNIILSIIRTALY
ncbi:MAG: hypothetical protein EZS28_010811 [Streblomastix strix]|uniref:Uncharacterized protein n=1 Tax=Streblomastix strix TaxID=222440 RepID=A0A5J4WFA0_9EUKA|nr:MAG: hypothetical protein EZS28_010811 [Streblomastix strix]